MELDGAGAVLQPPLTSSPALGRPGALRVCAVCVALTGRPGHRCPSWAQKSLLGLTPLPQARPGSQCLAVWGGAGWELSAGMEEGSFSGFRFQFTSLRKNHFLSLFADNRL